MLSTTQKLIKTLAVINNLGNTLTLNHVTLNSFILYINPYPANVENMVSSHQC
jgi:hypothetical protein